MEMVSAYATLANTGYKVEPYFIETITDRDSKVIYRARQAVLCDECYQQYLPKEEVADTNDSENLLQESVGDEQPDIQQQTEQANTAAVIEEPTLAKQETAAEQLHQLENELQLAKMIVAEPYDAPRVMSADNNYLTVSMLKDVVRRGTARKALVLNRQDLAGKTGTTNDYVDAWFSGFTSKLATTVWVGFDDPATMGKGEAGSKAALPIWVDYMRTALQGVAQDSDALPNFIEQGWVNRVSGKRTDEMDPQATIEYFPIEKLLPHRLSQLSALEYADLERQNLNHVENNSHHRSTFDETPSTFDESMGDDVILNDSELDLETGSAANDAEKQRIIESEEETEGLF